MAHTETHTSAGTAPAAAAEVVRLTDVSVNYDGTPALEGVNLTVQRNDFLGIIGPNGGGKSTLLKAMLGLVPATRGAVQLWGEPPQRSASRVGYVPQHSFFDREFPIAAWDVVLMGRLSRPHLLHRYTADDRQRAVRALDAVGIAQLKNRPIGEMSGGQQQRVFIARALVRDPELLLLDEPLANVDTTTQDDIYRLLAELRTRMTIVMVSHNLSAISTYVDKVACLNVRLYYHGSREIPPEDVEAAYGCPIELLAHGMPHRVLRRHD
ncbi:MAG: metal ABC transporter ATP-binding protein [Dehalococcoidia bacterium]|jgi:zinc transport system ATP-binding protein|nr:metal ABC transporter ATP-binding protein [Dehalococcoidia bacterium]